MKVIMYGMMICPDCEESLKLLQEDSAVEVEFRDFNSETAHLKEFLKYRDTNPMFDEIRAEGKIGIPLFVLEDDSLTFDINEVLKQKQ